MSFAESGFTLLAAKENSVRLSIQICAMLLHALTGSSAGVMAQEITSSTEPCTTCPAARSADTDPTTASKSEAVTYLSSLDLSKVRQGHGQPHADQSMRGKPISLGGKQ